MVFWLRSRASRKDACLWLVKIKRWAFLRFWEVPTLRFGDCNCEAWHKYNVSGGGECYLGLLPVFQYQHDLGCSPGNNSGWCCRRSSPASLPVQVFTWPACELVWGTDPSEKVNWQKKCSWFSARMFVLARGTGRWWDFLSAAMQIYASLKDLPNYSLSLTLRDWLSQNLFVKIWITVKKSLLAMYFFFLS